MVRLNNVIPNGHFHKNWQSHVKTWFDQPMKKKRRAMKRKSKFNRSLPKPAEYLRPIVHCPTIRYHSKVKPGRGFSLQELKQAGLNKHFAQTIGISFDKRRINKSIEAKSINIQRLKEYQSKLIIFPLNKKKLREELNKPIKTTTKGINNVVLTTEKVKARVPSDEEKKFAACICLRKARADAKYYGIRLKRKKVSRENIEPLLLKKGRHQSHEE